MDYQITLPAVDATAAAKAAHLLQYLVHQDTRTFPLVRDLTAVSGGYTFTFSPLAGCTDSVLHNLHVVRVAHRLGWTSVGSPTQG